MEGFGYKGGCGKHVLRHLDEEQDWAIDKQLWVIGNIMQLYH